MPDDLTHVNERGRVHMVNVGHKKATQRRAIAECWVRVSASTLAKIREQKVTKGDVLATARIAGIMAAKKTADLIPLCHAIALSSVDVEITFEATGLKVRATVGTCSSTGVEMEAITAVSVAAITLYDMLKSVERGISITDIALLEKHGGKSGSWTRDA